jgi:hypothetical protein
VVSAGVEVPRHDLGLIDCSQSLPGQRELPLPYSGVSVHLSEQMHSGQMHRPRAQRIDAPAVSPRSGPALAARGQLLNREYIYVVRLQSAKDRRRVGCTAPSIDCKQAQPDHLPGQILIRATILLQPGG